MSGTIWTPLVPRGPRGLTINNCAIYSTMQKAMEEQLMLHDARQLHTGAACATLGNGRTQAPSVLPQISLGWI